MRSFLDKIFLRTNNLSYISQNIKELSQRTPAKEIIEAIESYSSDSEVRYVGGCIRKIINKENIDDIDLATNLEPPKVCEALKKNSISYFESGIEHGTITAVVGKYKFEITTLRKDVFTDGRHAKIEFSNDWKEDASRRDFTFNAIYADRYGNLFDPFNGKKDLEDGAVNFIGEADKRIREDYLRILRYFRFFLNYSKQKHNLEIISSIKRNIGGISKLSKERLFHELKKIIKLNSLERLAKDKLSLDLILIIFPELKNIKIFSKLSTTDKIFLKDKDFIFLLSLLIIDHTDNTDYFLYKYNISKKDQKRIKNIDSFYKDKINSKTFLKDNMNKIFYHLGKQTTLDILDYRIIKSKKIDNSIGELSNFYKNNEVPKMPINADLLMKKYEIPEGKYLGEKLKMIEEEWLKNNFRISDQQIDNIINT